MTGRIVPVYATRRWMSALLQAFTIVGTLVLLIEFVEAARRFGGFVGYSVGSGFLLAALKTPFTLQAVTPYIFVIATVVCISRLNRRFELVAIWNLGTSPRMLLAPVCAVAFVAGLVVVGVLNPGAARAIIAAEQIQARIQGLEVPPDQPVALPWVTQRTPEGLVVIGARWTAGRGLVLNEATFLLFDHQGAFVERVDARRAVLEDDGWRLESARHTAVDGKRSDIGTGRVRSAISPQAFSQYQVNPDKVSIFALPAAIETARAIGWPSARFATRLHGLIALPFLLAGLTLVVAVATLPFPKDGWGIRQIAFALALCFGLYVVMLVFSALSSAGVLSPVVAAWLPVAAVALAGTAGLLYVDP